MLGRLKRLEAERRCWQLAKECLEMIRRLDMAVKRLERGERLAPVGSSSSRENSPSRELNLSPPEPTRQNKGES